MEFESGLTRETRGASAQHATRAAPTHSSHGPMRAQEEEVAVFTLESITKENPPNANQAQHRPKPRFDE